LIGARASLIVGGKHGCRGDPAFGEATLNWDIVIGVSTVIGVIGGLVSVVFLILEVRRNAQAIEGATVQSLMNFEQSVYSLAIAHAPLVLAGGADRAALSPEERFTYDNVVQAYMSLYYSAFEQHRNALIDAEVWEAYRNAIRHKMRDPGFAESWQEVSESYPAPFRQAVTSL
jgi:hypothetical protein